MRVLVLEDEDALREQLVRAYQQEGYAVDGARDGEEGLYFGREFPFDIAIVDLGLPKMSGIDVIRAWRSEGKSFPVLILTARGRWQEKVEALEAGADDYVVKPFHMPELLARTKALLRRATGWAQSTIECDYISLDMNAKTVTADGQPVQLTAYEYKVLEYLMLHSGKVVSKSDLTDHIYDQDFERDSNVIEVFIRRLRRKLDPSGERNPIETLRGQGYRFVLGA